MMKMDTAYLDLVAWLTFAPPAWVTMVSRVLVLTSLTLSLFLLFEHLAAYKNPEVTPNLYGNLVANTAGGIAGRTGVMPGGNVGKENIVKQKKANPVALLLSSAMMLRQHLQFLSFTDRLETAVEQMILEGKVRKKDLGGDSTTQEVVDSVIANLD